MLIEPWCSLLLGAGPMVLATERTGLSPKEISCYVHVGGRLGLASCGRS